MTVNTLSARTVTNGNGTTTAFPTGFEFNASLTLVVTLVVIATGVETLQVITTNYTVAGGLGNEGTVNMIVAPTSLEALVVERVEVQDQQTDYTRNDPFPAEVNEAALDKLTFLIQESLDKVGRAILLSITYTGPQIIIPGPRDGYILIGTADGGYENVHISDLPGLGGGTGGEVNPDLISQAEAEAGVAETERIFSALRVAQAIEAMAVTINDDIRTGSLAIVSTDPGFIPGPTLTLYRDSESPAANDELGSTYFDGNNSDLDLTAYARVIGVILDPAAGAEDGEMQLQTVNNGVFLGQLSIGEGVRIGVPAGTYMGYGTVNVQSGYYVNGVQIGAGDGEANPEVVSQVDAEAGTATDERIWTAERVKQAIAALETGGESTEFIVLAASDETSNLTTGTSKITFRMPYAFTLTDVRISVATAPTDATIIVDINKNGTTILSTKLTIDATERTSTTAATPVVISDTALADDVEITVDIDQVGSTIAGVGLKVYLIGTET